MRKQGGAISRGSYIFLLLMATAVITYFGWQLNANNKVVQLPEEIEDYLFWHAKDLTDFTLVGAEKKTLGLDNLKGKWSFIFLGYTQCPDVCPMTLAKMGAAFKQLQKDPAVSSDIQGVFVSVDPMRDTPKRLKEYVSYFNPKFLGVTGSTAQVDTFARQIGALYTLHKKASNEDYLVTHNSSIFLIDPQGRLYGRFPPPHAANEIAEIFIKIRVFYHEQEDKKWPFF